jgi:DNA-binding transcriptional ArsR family regulator
MRKLKLDLTPILHQVKLGATIIRAINHPLRQRILSLIEEQGEICVSDIYHKLRLEQSVASAHLAIMRRAGLLEVRRDGHYIWYSVHFRNFQTLSHALNTLVSIDKGQKKKKTKAAVRLD